MGRSPIWTRALVALALLVSLASPTASRAAEPWSEEAYSAWVGDHALRLIAGVQLPPQFTLADLRDLAIELGNLADDARAVEPPPHWAGRHADYLRAMDAVERVRGELQTVVVTRQAAPGLREALFEAGHAVAEGLRGFRDEGVALPAYVLGLLGLGEGVEALALPATPSNTPAPTLGETVPSGTRAEGRASAATPPRSPQGSPPLSRSSTTASACTAEATCAVGGRLRVRVLEESEAVRAAQFPRARG